MAKEICISSTPHETRLAIIEDEQLAEIYYERENEYTLAGSIYKGRVTRVLPGMQSSFVDVGLERDAFLYVTDFLEEQEDSEDYVSEGNGGGGRSRPASGDEPQAAPPTGDRLSEPAERSSGRSGQGRSSEGRSNEARSAEPREPGRDRNSDRDRNQGRRSTPLNTDSTREQSREQARATREQAREQAVAPLREAVPAAEDLDDKGDEQAPEGTRRWRGRRGRRRGVRSGLPAEPQPQSSIFTPQGLAEASTAEQDMAAPFILAERGAPGGVESLHPTPAPQLETPRVDRVDRADRGGRDRTPRRSREPYAQASTLVRSDQPRTIPESQPANQPQASAPQSAAGPMPTASPTAIILPGESLSKYGSAPAVPGEAAPTTATVPKTIRPVNYVAPKPSTLVELASNWDGGAVLPGESLSRYSAPPPHQPSPEITASALARQSEHASAHAPADHSELRSTLSAGTEPTATAEDGLDQTDTQPAEFAPTAESWEPQDDQLPTSEASALDFDESVSHTPAAGEPEPAEPATAEQTSEPWGTGEAPQHPEPTPLAEPEIVAQAGSPEAEAPSAHVAQPEMALALEPSAVAPVDAAEPAPAPPAEYEPEHASASYRVPTLGASELRLAAPDFEAEEPAQVAAEPFGSLLADHAVPADEHDSHFFHQLPVEVEELNGSLLHGTGHAPHEHAEHVLSILHEDGDIETAPVHDLPESAHPAVAYAENEGPIADVFADHAEPFQAAGFAFESVRLCPAAEAQQADADHAPMPSDFSTMVDQLQGFAPGTGLLEEEVIDEDEYDFEPLHAQSDEHDQEDLEEETLDQQIDAATLSDAVRDSHLEQRVHQPEATAFIAEDVEEAEEPHETSFGYKEVDTDEDDEEEGHREEGHEEEGEDETGAQSAQPGSEPQRRGRTDDGRSRDRGRSGGRSGGRRNSAPGRGRTPAHDLPVISDMLKQGQEILVQIAKEPIAKKGARITSHIALPGRFLVFMPTVNHVGVSRKIASDEERLRLKRILISEKGESSGGFIVRTAADGASEEDLRADLRFLISLWTEVKQRSETAKAPALIYHDLNLIERILRDQVSSNFSTIWVDSEAEYERIIRFLSRFQPGLVRRVKLYSKETPLFEHFGIQEEISKALKSKVWLKSGGSIVINQTEALVAIDINTGKYVGKTSRLEDTIVKTNLDAISEIVRQIRLRDLGGIIVIDFIDMDERKNRNRVLAALEEELKHDRAPSKVLQFNDFGLVAITRKRVKQSLERTLSVTCETCTGTGMVKSPTTVCNEIYIEMRKMRKHLDGKDVMLRVHPEVVKQLKTANGKWLNELEELVAKTIIIKSDAALHPEQFDIH